MEIDQKKIVKVNAKTLKLHMKVTDRFQGMLVDQDGATIHEQEEGYVPSFFPGPNYGDYLILDIELDTGKILNWKPPTAKQIQEWMKPEEG